MKTLFVNGCSWTYGGGLDRPNRQNQFNFPYEPGTKEHLEYIHNEIVWPAHVKKLMNFDRCVNLAEGCGSNQRICRTTFDWVNQQDEETLKNKEIIRIQKENEAISKFPEENPNPILRLDLNLNLI